MKDQIFRFKQFSINQDQCAMKIGVDSVLLGSWCCVPESGHALDIGTGTGLLALMIAQRSSDLKIKAVEIEAAAANQAKENFANSRWSDRLEILNYDIKSLDFGAQKFELIIANPPYFIVNQRNPHSVRNSAREERDLDIGWIMANCSQLLSSTGRLHIVYPYEDLDNLKDMASRNDLHINRVCKVFGKRRAEIPKRVLLEIGKNKKETESSSISIRDNGLYSSEYKDLTKEFYLELK